MKIIRTLFIVSLLLFISPFAKAQIQIDYLSFKGFSSVGFGAFFNFAVPVSDADYVTAEAGLDVFSHNGDNVAIAPVLLGYRYTLDQTGTGFFIEPNAGYAFAGTDIQVYNADNYQYEEQKLNGFSTGVTLGYLFEPSGRIQFNLGLRYEHVFGDLGSNLFSFRIAHAFTFGRKD